MNSKQEINTKGFEFGALYGLTVALSPTILLFGAGTLIIVLIAIIVSN